MSKRAGYFMVLNGKLQRVTRIALYGRHKKRTEDGKPRR
jgi:hypothetical protein